jgi:voltage-gated potassium channel
MKKRIPVIIQLLGGSLTFFILLILIWIFEKQNEHSSIKTLFDAFWYSVVTLTTVGYGDYYPVTQAGKVIGLILVIFSLGLLGYIISNLTNKIREYMEKKKLGQFGTDTKGHVVIIGWNNFSKLIADQVVQAKQNIVIITDKKDDLDLIHDIYSEKVLGLFSELNTFENFSKINIENSSSVFISIRSDSDTLVYLLNIKKVFPSINVVISLSNSELKDTFYSAGANYVISEKELSSRLIASFIFEPDVAYYTEDLITTALVRESSDILELKIKEGNPFVDREYLQAFFDLKKKYNSVLIGLSRKKGDVFVLNKNPGSEEVILKGDYLILISDGHSKKRLIQDFGVPEGRTDT